jgi:hypothetical protein
MIENEDSVVTSLNELRKLKNERISRQTQSRPVSMGSRAVALAEDPLADQLTPPPMQPSAVVAAARAPSPFEQPAFAVPAPNRLSAPAPAFETAPMVAPPVIQTKTSYKAAVIMTVLLGGAGAAGYMKLQNDTQQLVVAKDAAIKSAEEARMRSVEVAAKADMVAKNNLRQCEDKLKASLAAASVAPAAPAAAASAAAAPVVEKKPEKPAVAAKAARGGHRVAARPVKQAAAAPAPAGREAKEKSGDIPTIAKKKKLDNDPLAGLGKL